MTKIVLKSFIVQNVLTGRTRHSESASLLIRFNYPMQEALKQAIRDQFWPDVLKEDIKLADSDNIDTRILVTENMQVYLSKPFIPLTTVHSSEIDRCIEQRNIILEPNINTLSQYGISCTCSVDLIFNKLQVLIYTTLENRVGLFVYINSMSAELVSSLLVSNIADTRGCLYWT